jgi:cell filamentation protein
MYDAVDDPYTYENSTVLINKLDLRDQAELDDFEAEISSARASEPLPGGDLDFAHYCAVHRHLFQDVYEWAGMPRTVRISKQGNPFCFPEHIHTQASKVFADLKARASEEPADERVRRARRAFSRGVECNPCIPRR